MTVFFIIKDRYELFQMHFKLAHLQQQQQNILFEEKKKNENKPILGLSKSLELA